MAGLVASHGHTVVMWSYDPAPAHEINELHTNSCYLSDYTLPENVSATCSHEEALAGADAVIFAVPSSFLRGVARDCAPYISDGLPVLCLAKGIELGHEEALAGADAVIFAVPSSFLRGVARDCAPYISDGLPVLCLAKGIELGTGLLMSDVIASEIGHPCFVWQRESNSAPGCL